MYGIPPFGGYGYVRVSSLLAVRWVIMVIPNFQMDPSISGWSMKSSFLMPARLMVKISRVQKLLWSCFEAALKMYRFTGNPSSTRRIPPLVDDFFLGLPGTPSFHFIIKRSCFSRAWKATMKPWKAIWRPCRGQWLRMLCDRNFWSFVWAFLLLTCRSNGWVGWWWWWWWWWCWWWWWRWWRQIRESVGQRSEAVATTRRTYWILKIKIG